MKHPRAVAIASILAAMIAMPAFAEKRVALVIGNGNYANLPDLRNPVNDAADIAAALTKLGFSVTLKTDADRRTMNQAIVAFREELASDQQSEGVFYFAGHGVQSSKGENYLMPVDVIAKSETDLEDEAVRARKLLDSLDEARNRVNLVILDACRDNPLPATARSAASRGLAVVSQAPPETVLLYSTAAGQTASDGVSGSRNSPFTAALLKHLSNPSDITQVIKLVTGEVKATTPEKQTPFVYSNLSRDFVLNKSGGAAAQASAPSKAPSFGAVSAATGNLSVQLASAGTVSVAGLSAAVPAGTVPVNDLPAGSQTVTVRYADGKTESRTVTVPAGGTASVSFTYAPPASTSAPTATPATGSDTAGAKSTSSKPEQKFSIGDIGPAGGIIFYDKGHHSDGWRYLEAAPSDQSVAVEWNTSAYFKTGLTFVGIGKGLSNTTTLTNKLGKGMYAAQLCNELVIGTYDDWFLPSKDELNLMYNNLFKNGLGFFSPDFYWSSSDDYGGNYGYVAWGQSFNNGSQFSTSQTAYKRVRAIRSF